MNKHLVIIIIFTFSLLGCEKDDGFRAVQIEITFDAIPDTRDPFDSKFVSASTRVSAFNPSRSIEAYGASGEDRPKKTIKSPELVLAVNTEITRKIEVYAGVDGTSLMPCDVRVQIKADNKVIWSHTVKKGEVSLEEEATLIVR
jgi:hypothetical protein